ncbi:hypothetical protein [Williamsia sterculiae]|uniref:hypothetical protein n=1 Tax=Williamsia sterculiae TaxID=1344003 RepID=UPI0013566457|nr:hypothetical protein [Williamsia sterculiae]
MGDIALVPGGNRGGGIFMGTDQVVGAVVITELEILQQVAVELGDRHQAAPGSTVLLLTYS